MKEINGGIFTGERALFGKRDLTIRRAIFDDGESPLKECGNIKLYETMFKWKYPLWHCTDITLKDCVLFETARAGIWYTDRLTAEDCAVEAPKQFRRCRDIRLNNINFVNAAETLWSCSGITLENVCAHGDYFAMNSTDITAENLEIIGNYSFDGAQNAEIKNAKLLSKDAFWNSENVTVSNSFISGEYLGWNSRNLTFINCTIESLQGLCRIENLRLENCRLINTTLAFEYSTVEAKIEGTIDSVKNPRGGVIESDGIGELIMEPDKTDATKTRIINKNRDNT